MAKAEREKEARFFRAITENNEVKVGPTEQEVEEYFKNRNILQGLVWFEGSVDRENDGFSFKLFDDKQSFQLNKTHHKRIQIEVVCYVAGIYGVKKKDVPGSVRSVLADLLRS